MNVIEYHRLSTDELQRLEEAEVRTGVHVEPFATQRQQTSGYCTAFGYVSVGVEEDGAVSTKLSIEKRPGLWRALERIRAGEADGIVATKVDRISRDTGEFVKLMDDAKREEFAIVALDLGIDTSTAAGELLGTVLAALGKWERRRIGERTSEALRARQAAGVTLGRPVLVQAEALDAMRALRAAGYSYQAIARQVSADGHRTPSGERVWSKSTVHNILTR